MERKNLPTLSDLYNDKAMTIKQNQLNELLNKDPKPEWIGYHPVVKIEKIDPKTGQKYYEPIPYIPIARLEWLMFRIYTKWRKEIINVMLMANSAVVTMRVHYKDPITGDWEWTDGVGAAPLQTNKGAGATDFMQIKSNAVQIGAPAAASYAFKNAVASLGKLFGKDLVRNDEIAYNLGGEINSLTVSKLRNEISQLLSMNQDKVQVKEIVDLLTQKEDAGEADIVFYENILKDLKGESNGKDDN